MNMMMNDGVTVAGNELFSESGGYARIGDVARKYGVTLRALRFYEDKGLISPHRDGTTRLYSKRDCTRLKLILLGRKVGFSLREVKQMIGLYEPASSNTRQLKVAIEKGEKQLKRLDKQRAAVDEAINELSSTMNIARSQLALALAARSGS